MVSSKRMDDLLLTKLLTPSISHTVLSARQEDIDNIDNVLRAWMFLSSLTCFFSGNVYGTEVALPDVVHTVAPLV